MNRPDALAWSGEASVEEVVRALEVELAEPAFRDVELGSTLQDLLSSVFIRSTASLDWAARRRVILQGLVHRIVGAEARGATDRLSGLEPHRILVVTISTRAYHRRTVPRIVAHLGPEVCHVLTDDPGLRRALPDGSGAFGWRDLPALHLREWRREYRCCRREWARRLGEIRFRHGLHPAAVALIRHALLVSSQRVMRSEALVKRLQPTAVLVEYDRNARGAPLVLVAKRLGVPTLTLVHGVINGPLGYTPILADRVLCWGEHQRDQLIAMGTDPNRVEPVGFDRLEPGAAAGGEAVRARLGLDEEGLIVMLATNPIDHTSRHRLVYTFCEAVIAAPRCRGVVRLHPSESLTSYDGVRREFPGVRFTANEELSPEEAFAVADVVVAHSSGFAGEALVRGCLAVVLDVIDHPLGHGADLIRLAGAPRARDVNELRDVLDRVSESSELRAELKRGAARYIRNFYTALGDEACRNIAQVVIRHALPGSPKDHEAIPHVEAEQEAALSGGGVQS